MVPHGTTSEAIDAQLASLMTEQDEITRGDRSASDSKFESMAAALAQEMKDDPFLNSCFTGRAPGKGPVSKIVILVGRLPAQHGQAVVQVFKYLKGLSGLCDVLFVVTNEPNKAIKIGSEDRESARIAEEKYTQETLENTLTPDRLARVQFLSAACWTTEGVAAMLRRIDDFEPDAALCFLGLIQSRIVRPLLSRHMGLLEVQFNISNQPSKECHVVLAHGRSPNFRDRDQPRRWTNHKIPIEVPEDDSTHVAGVQAEGYPEHLHRMPGTSLRLVTVLSMDRITSVFNRRYKDADFEFLDRLFDTYPDMDWVFIGLTRSEDFTAISEVLGRRANEGRIKTAGWIGNLAALYRESDIFVHFPGLTGGTMGMAIAIDKGVPAITGRKTDCANIIREDHTFEYNEDFFLGLEQLIQNKTLRDIKVAEQQSHLKRFHSVDSVAQDLMKYAKQARHRFSRGD